MKSVFLLAVSMAVAVNIVSALKEGECEGMLLLLERKIFHKS